MKDMRKVLHDILEQDLTSGEVLRGLRIKLGLSQEKLAELTKIQRTNLSALENNRTPMTSYYAEILAIIFDVHPADILYPNGRVQKTSEILKLEKNVKKYLKKLKTA